MSHTLGNFELAPEDWSTLRRLLAQALELPVAAREGWLDRLPAAERRFVRRLRELLAHADGSAALLGSLPQVETEAFAGPLPDDDEAQLAPGREVGPYRLVAPLGEGGMASVWLAERSDMLQARRVALKLPQGAWRQHVWAERLAREREILATLSHPNIAALYDAGIADGRPWLALEYVEGLRLDEHCAARALDLRARLALFLQVADAVAHAHARLVVHRDLKPSNILVRDDGQVRLLDFGIAKLMEQGQAEETALTRETGRALTPDYAAPEQIAGQPIGTAADIYSLGVLLYELLAGTRPYRLKRGSRAELEEAIVAAEPARPSDATTDAKRRRQLRGDLDTIVMKALKKAPAERYGSVVELAEDVRRHLDGQPVKAQPDRWTYRSAKFIARHRMGVAAGALAIGAVLSGSALALWQMVEARTQRDAALYQQQRADATNQFLGNLLEDIGPADRPLTLSQLLDRSTRLLEEQVGVERRFAAGMLYEASRRYATLNDTRRELQLLDRAAALAAETGDRELLASSRCAAAMALFHRDREAGNRQLALLTEPPATLPARIVCLRAQAVQADADGRADRAVATLQSALALLPGDDAQQAAHKIPVLNELGHLHHKHDRTAAAEATTRETLRLYDRSGRGGTLGKAVALMNHAAVLTRGGELLAAATQQQAALALVGRIDPSGEPPVGYATHYATTLHRLARYDEALDFARADVERARRVGNERMVALASLQQARTLIKLGRHAEAAPLLADAEALFQRNAKTNQRILNELALTRADQALLQGRTDHALAAVARVLDALGYPARPDGPGVGSALHTAARVHLARGDAQAAEQAAAASLAMAERTALDVRRSAGVGQAELLRTRALVLAGEQRRAAQAASRAHQALRQGFGDAHPETREAAQVVAQLAAGGTAVPVPR